jgi:hypothetical protein
VVPSGQIIGARVCIAKSLTEVSPPMIIAMGRRQAPNMPNTIIQMMQPETVLVFVTFMPSPLYDQNQREKWCNRSSWFVT